MYLRCQAPERKNKFSKEIINKIVYKAGGQERGVYLKGLITYGNYEIEDQVNFTVYVPKVDEHFVGSLVV